MSTPSDQAARLIEAERAQIAHEIHDSLLPLMFAASASLSSMADGSDQEVNPRVRQRIEQAKGWIDDAMRTGRHLLTEIYPPELKGTVWTLAVRDTVERLLGESAENIDWRLDPAIDRLPDPTAFAAYRIVVEAVRNAVKHGEATEIVVDGDRRQGEIRVTVRDNGKGFDPDSVPDDRFGIRSMSGRAELVGGSLNIDSKAGGPTVVSFCLPSVDEGCPAIDDQE